MHLTTEWSHNCPTPDVQQVAAKVKRLSVGHRPVSIIAIAKEFGINVGAALNVLESTAQQGLVRAVTGQGWLPLKT